MSNHDNQFKKAIKKLYAFFGEIAPESATKILFRKYLGYKLDLENPETLNEKMQYLKLRVYKDDPLVTRCADKYAVRSYVEQCGCGDTLVPLLGVWDKAEDIDFEKLPNKFVLKCNHGSGTNIICTNKSELDIDNVRKRLNEWLVADFGKQRVEMSYEKIDRKIIAESYIETDDKKPPKDYKIFCAYGEPKFLFVASDRYDNKTKFDYFSLDWEWIPVKNGHPNAGKEALPCPKGYKEMLSCAQKLSKPFPLVRVDFYYENEKVIFGELTFLHFGGLVPFEPNSYDRIFGDMIDVDIKQGVLK